MFNKICEGDVFLKKKENKANVSGSRAAVLPDGKIICSFNCESGSGVNDFTPYVSYSDDGRIWSEAKPLWPGLTDTKSLSTSVRPTEDNRISIAGIGFDISCQGESWWSDELAAMKENYIVFSISDDGYSFEEPKYVRPLPGEACENPGGMFVDENGNIDILYSPYPTIGEPEKADTNKLVLMHSDDNGNTFSYQNIALSDPPCQYAEAWIVRLGNGRKLIGVWQTAASEHTDKYLLSDENGNFGPVTDLPFNGQSMALTPYGEGGVILVYNQRKEKNPGVWAAYMKAERNHLVLVENKPVWLSSTTTRNNSSGNFTEWTDFSFGEPHACILPNGNILTVFWYEESGFYGIHYVITD